MSLAGIEQCDALATEGGRCCYVAGHRGEHLYTKPGEGDQSDAIRLRFTRDKLEDLREATDTRIAALEKALDDAIARWTRCQAIADLEGGMDEESMADDRRALAEVCEVRKAPL